MDYYALKDLIDSDPGNATRTDEQVLAWLYSPVPVFVDIQVSDIAGTVEQRQIYPSIETGAATNSSSASLLRIVSVGSPIQTLRYADETKRISIDALLADTVASGTLTQADADAILALGVDEVTVWRDGDIIENPAIGDVTTARAL